MCLIGDGGAGKVGLIQPFYAAQITWRAPHCHMLLDHLINFLSPIFLKIPIEIQWVIPSFKEEDYCLTIIHAAKLFFFFFQRHT